MLRSKIEVFLNNNNTKTTADFKKYKYDDVFPLTSIKIRDLEVQVPRLPTKYIQIKYGKNAIGTPHPKYHKWLSKSRKEPELTLDASQQPMEKRSVGYLIQLKTKDACWEFMVTNQIYLPKKHQKYSNWKEINWGKCEAPCRDIWKKHECEKLLGVYELSIMVVMTPYRHT